MIWTWKSIEYMRCDSDFEEAEYVVYRIRKIVRSGNTTRDIAVYTAITHLAVF